MQETICKAGDVGLIPGLGRSPGEGNGNPLQYFCLGNPMDRSVWQDTVHEVAQVRHDLATKPPPPTIVKMLWVQMKKKKKKHKKLNMQKQMRNISREMVT